MVSLNLSKSIGSSITELDQMCQKYKSECGPVITRLVKKENNEMQLEYGISKEDLIKVKQSSKNKYKAFLAEFLESGQEVAKVNFKADKKYSTIYSGLMTCIRKEDLPCNIVRVNGCIFIVRKDNQKNAVTEGE